MWWAQERVASTPRGKPTEVRVKRGSKSFKACEAQTYSAGKTAPDEMGSEGGRSTASDGRRVNCAKRSDELRRQSPPLNSRLTSLASESGSTVIGGCSSQKLVFIYMSLMFLNLKKWDKKTSISTLLES